MGPISHATDQAGEPIRRATDLTGTLVLKHDRFFLLSDAFGDVRRDHRGLGLYLGDTRVLSRYELLLDGQRPVVLRTSSSASWRGTIQMTNPDLVRNPMEKGDAAAVLSRQSLGIVRDRSISDAFEERIRVHNYTLHPERCLLTLGLDADFADIFEVRGVLRKARGRRQPTEVTAGLIGFGYTGLDERFRRTWVQVDAGAAQVTSLDDPTGSGHDVLLGIELRIPPGGEGSLDIRVTSEVLDTPLPPRRQKRPAVGALAGEDPEAAHRAWHATSTAVSSTHVAADRAFRRGMTDLRLLVDTGPLPGERYIAAGIPWYDTLFGRDAILTALQMLLIRPRIARDTLTVLARLQATERDDRRDAQPGKILHELRTGELAAVGEIPHTPYYGSVDATPLWLVLLGEYHLWTGDAELVDRLWPAVLAALGWIDSATTADGFLAYHRQADGGLLNQGWKDSADAIRWADGRLAEGSIALVEVQGYVFAARTAAARLARARGDAGLAESQEAEAEALRARFEDRFWLEASGTYALALDGTGRAVDAVTSNPGHTLWSGICSAERASRVATSLLSPEMFSGWGIRTLSRGMAGYNPISYHIGSVWPHDNAIAAAGLWHYGHREEAARVAGALLEATQFFRDARLPELFCGFDRSSSPYPVPYPVACSPQAWASGSIFGLLGAMLGLRPNAAGHELQLVSPTLPPWLSEVRLDNLVVGDAVVDLLIRRTDGSTGVEVLRRSGSLDVVVRV
jgi:glycogen debranching enzyme